MMTSSATTLSLRYIVLTDLPQSKPVLTPERLICKHKRSTMSEQERFSNAQVIEIVKRLIDSLKKDGNDKRSAPLLSHYRIIPDDVKTAYDLMMQGAQAIHATSTKYTLVGKAAAEEQYKLVADLLRGCELIGAGVHVVLQDGAGCARSARHSAVRAGLAVFVNVLHLVECFEDGSVLENEKLGAQKTGAVWESCNTILNKLLPQGNRNAMRRELFTWTREINDTMEEFQELIDLGPGEVDAASSEEEDDFGDDQQYSDDEIGIAKSCVGLIKCSRGCMKVTIEASEALGSNEEEQNIQQISKLQDFAREVGEGVTDLGSAMYPPLASVLSELRKEIKRQVKSVIELNEFVSELGGLPSEVTELSKTLLKAAKTRSEEIEAATMAMEKN